MQNIGYIIVAILALVFMIVVHEFGHYLAGKKLGFQINEFAIGFGPPIFKKKLKSGEQFSIRPIPLGGFCSFEGEEEDKDNPRAFNNMPPWKRIIVLFSGAFFNFVSAMIIITIFFCAFGEQVAVIGTMYENGVNTGVLQEGDIILKVDGKVKHILMNDDFSKMLEKTGDTATLKIMRDGKCQTVTIKKGSYSYFAPKSTENFYQFLYIQDNAYKVFNPDGWTLTKIKDKKADRFSEEDRKNLPSGTELTFKNNENGSELTCFVTVVREGDRLMYINDTFIPPCGQSDYNNLTANLKDGDYIMFQQRIEGGDYSVPIVIDQNSIRDFNKNIIAFDYMTAVSGHTQLNAVAPDSSNPDGLETYGFGFTRRLESHKLGFFKSLGRSFTFSFFIVFKVLALLGALITGKMSLKSAGGPITVISTVSTGIKQAGFPYLMYITCILSANLAVMNLLPLPALDGSKIVFTGVEWIRGKPLNRKVEAAIHTVGLLLLFTFTIFIDIFHMVS